MQKWEYLFGVFQNALRPHTVNGIAPKDWEKGPEMHEFANQMGEQGWELVEAPYYKHLSYGSGTIDDSLDLRVIFKRPRE